MSGRDGAAGQLRVFDTDVHHGMWGAASLFPYLGRAHRERLREYGFAGGGGYASNGGERGYRGDLFEDDRRPSYPASPCQTPACASVSCSMKRGLTLRCWAEAAALSARRRERMSDMPTR